MKKVLVNLIMMAMIFVMIAPGVSAQSNNVSKENSFKNGLSEELIKEVDEYVKVVGNSYELTNPNELNAKISKSDLDKVKKQIAKTNELLKQNGNFERTSNNNFKVEMTDKEITEKAAERGYEFDDSGQKDGDNHLFNEGINKVNVHWWGFEVWLSKTSVSRIISGGLGAASTVLGILTGGVAIPVAAAINAFVWSIFADQRARAIYFTHNVITGGINNFEYQ